MSTGVPFVAREYLLFERKDVNARPQHLAPEKCPTTLATQWQLDPLAKDHLCSNRGLLLLVLVSEIACFLRVEDEPQDRQSNSRPCS